MTCSDGGDWFRSHDWSPDAQPASKPIGKMYGVQAAANTDLAAAADFRSTFRTAALLRGTVALHGGEVVHAR